MAEEEEDVRGFSQNEHGHGAYMTRDGTSIQLSPDQYKILRVIEDVVNKHLFVNTMDLKRSIQTLRGKEDPKKTPYRKPPRRDLQSPYPQKRSKST